jgi:HlyD family secretion protein
MKRPRYLSMALAALIIAVGCARHGQKLIEASGIIEVTEVTVRSKITGRVVALGFEEGRPVAAGALLARLAAEELGAQERQALAALTTARQQQAAAETNFRLADDTYRRNQELYKSGTLSEQSFYQIESGMKAAKSQLAAVKGMVGQAEAGLSLVRTQASNAVIEAPVAGVVLQKSIEEGELAMPYTPVCTIGDLARPSIKLYLPETIYGRVKLGQAVRITVDSYPGRTFNGTVATIASQAEFTPKDIQTKEERTKLVFAVKVAIQNPGGELKPGMPADAVIELENP